MFRALCDHHQEVKIVLCSIWYHHTVTSEWSEITKIQFYKYKHMVVKFMYLIFGCDYCILLTINMLCHVEVTFVTNEKFIHKFYYHVLIFIELYFSNFRPLTCYSVMIPYAV